MTTDVTDAAVSDQTDAPVPVLTPDVARLIREGIDKVNAGQLTLGDLINAVITPSKTAAISLPVVPVVTQITPAHRAALKRLPAVFAQVAPDVVRELTTDEKIALVEERDVIDTLLSLLGERKTNGIREILAGHFDRKAEREDRTAGAERDDRGHYLIKDADAIPEIDRKVTRELRTAKPTISGSDLLAAYERGELTRVEYLDCTREARVFDEAKTRAAIRKDPALLFKLPRTPGGTTASIFVR